MHIVPHVRRCRTCRGTSSKRRNPLHWMTGCAHPWRRRLRLRLAQVRDTLCRMRGVCVCVLGNAYKRHCQHVHLDMNLTCVRCAPGVHGTDATGTGGDYDGDGTGASQPNTYQAEGERCPTLTIVLPSYIVYRTLCMQIADFAIPCRKYSKPCCKCDDAPPRVRL